MKYGNGEKIELEYFMLRHYVKGTVVELETPVKVHIHTSNGYEFDFSIGYIWSGMVGFDVWQGSCCCCTVDVGSVLTMPDGTVIENRDNTKFISDVAAWVKSSIMKLEVSNEVEFMDI